MDEQLCDDLTDDQRRQFIDAQQIRSSWLAAEHRVANYRGSMYWQSSKGHAYLFREYSKENRKYMGPRTAETEKIYAEFKAGKASAEERYKALSEALARHERLNAAQRVGRTPIVVVKLLEELRKAGLQNHLMVIGTNALFAYEAHAGVRFHGNVTATHDVDLLWDSRKKLTLLAHADDNFSRTGLIGVLQKVDKSFELEEGKNSAANSQGYMVDLIKRRPLSLYDDQEQQPLITRPHDFWASKIRNMDWLLCSPKFKQVVAASNGKMAEMITVDPRAFVLFKVYLGEKDDRNPLKAPRDIAQAKAVYKLVQERMPQLGFDRIHVLPEKPRDERVFDILDPHSNEQRSLAKQLGAVAPFGEHVGTITAVTATEVIQHIGQGRHVAWERSKLSGASFGPGDGVTISKDGVLRPTRQQGRTGAHKHR
ncbi:GSU2403 family nucleotidyltransferase fold protein [Noviherbaspirillum pedocola]|uniref:Nucleotidyltransferase domain-containing protein n=1 Tax=Noviherbaspirillum pedocola TaxID=2801341 RepID=A0A934T301_9BURK|nr:nucleotidyltransferase domain-containing protein [Noviherbaspirillum pedocola]MBK4737303.1 nucleotidyltransferase domain-containing protein [Noviherbaspirillum pedocola]